MRGVWYLALAALVSSAALAGAALRETPTVDEIAHVPAGLVHWRHGQLELYRNNPPLGKLWVAAPLAADRSIFAPVYEGTGAGWDPWIHAAIFEHHNHDRYLGLMARARLMVLPLVFATAWLVFAWARSLYGAFAASLATSLFLLSPTLLAHGHLATVDVAAMATIFAAVLALRRAGAAPSWRRDALAGAALGLALAVKFSALFLVAVLPTLLCLQTLRDGAGRPWRVISRRLAVYAAAAWLVLGASMGFADLFAPIHSLPLHSQAARSLVEGLPEWLPSPLPRPYLTGLDALQQDVEAGYFRGYLRGEWSNEGRPEYYLVAFAVKEFEPVVLLALASLATVFVVRRRRLELATLLVPPAAFLFAAVCLTDLQLGIRYVLPAFPFLFVAIASVFALAEERWAGRGAGSGLRDRRAWLAVPLLGYALATSVLVFPSYLSYFNRFAGGPERGEEWLVDSNLDWGQDLYRLPAAAEALGVTRWRLVYFGHVDPSHYQIAYELPSKTPEFDVHAVSVNYWKGMDYGFLDRATGDLLFLQARVAWMAPLVPTARLGSILVFDLRESVSGVDPAVAAYNRGIAWLARGDAERAAASLEEAVRRRPDWAEARHHLDRAEARLQRASGHPFRRTARDVPSAEAGIDPGVPARRRLEEDR